MKTALEDETIPRYLRVYNYYKDLILSEKLPPETKLPSIRKGSAQFQVSRTTMESAYMLLAAEGYVIARPQSGYYVTSIAEKQNIQGSRIGRRKGYKRQEIPYDFVTSNVDRESFRFELWRRYMKSALRQDERLLSYGEPQGELEFREVLSTYLQKERSVICTPEQIVIGAGIQSLLHILCPLLSNDRKAAFYNTEFLQGRAIFEDYGYEIVVGYQQERIGVCYLSPSHMTKWGGIMPVTQRLDLIGAAERNKFLIIEDDYNSEIGYIQKPIPSLQGLAGGRGVVYMGTFSKILLPSIRMSFMVLPVELLEIYEKRRDMYNQTASKAEQIAITHFIRDGHLASQMRKSRKIQMAKATQLARDLKTILKEKVEIEIGESGFHVYVGLDTELNSEEVAKKALKKGVAVLPLPQEAKKTSKKTVVMFKCANVAAEDYQQAICILRDCL